MTTRSTTGAPGWRELRRHRIERERKEADARKQEREVDDDEEQQPRQKSKKKVKRLSPLTRLGSLPAMNANRWTGVIIWLLGAYLTRTFLMQLGVVETFATPIGFVLQWALTKAEGPLWQGKGYPRLALFATLIDGGINSGGAWPFMKNLGQTDFWTMISDIAGTPGQPPTLITIVACAVAIGLATAASAEYFWNL